MLQWVRENRRALAAETPLVSINISVGSRSYSVSGCFCLSFETMAIHVKYDQVRKLWDYLIDRDGIACVEVFMEFEMENVREIFIKCRRVWYGHVEEYCQAMTTAQVLSILTCMTVQSKYHGQFSEQTTFMKMEDVAGTPCAFADAPPLPEMLKLLFKRSGRKLLKSELKSGRRDFREFLMTYDEDEELKQLFAAADRLLANLEFALEVVG